MFFDIIMTADRENRVRIFSMRLLARVGAPVDVKDGTYINDYSS